MTRSVQKVDLNPEAHKQFWKLNELLADAFSEVEDLMERIHERFLEMPEDVRFGHSPFWETHQPMTYETLEKELFQSLKRIKGLRDVICFEHNIAPMQGEA